MAAKKPAIPAVRLLLDQEGLNRLRQFPKGSEEVLAALDAEQHRINQAHVAHNEVQRAKAKKPRGAGDDGRNTHQVVADIVKGHPIGAKPADLLMHVHAAMEENGMEPIKDKYAKGLIAQELSARKRRTPRT